MATVTPTHATVTIRPPVPQRVAAAVLATLGFVAAILVIVQPPGLSADWLRWLAVVELVCVGGLVLLPSIVAGTVTASDVRAALQEAEGGQVPAGPASPG